jgi:flagellin-like protein
MMQNNLKSNETKLIPKKRRGVAEVISTLLLVVITVAGAVLLTSFIDETFVSGSLAVTSSTDTTIKTVKLRAFDTRDGDGLMGYENLDNRNNATLQVLCRVGCNSATNANPSINDGSDFMVFQIHNQGINPINLKNIYLDNVNHVWDPDTLSKVLNPAAPTSSGGVYPQDGSFSILSSEMDNPGGCPDGFLCQKSNQINSGQTVNVLIKLDTIEDDIELSKTMRVQLNIGEKSLAEFLIESGGAQ